MEEILSWINQLSTSVPLEIFVFIGSILEEIIAPIPSPMVMGLAGFIAHQQQHGLIFYFWLACIGAVGKTIASYAFYVLGDKAEDVIVHRWGKYLGITEEKIEEVHNWMSKGWWDEALLVFLRVIPIIPTFILSIMCGVLKIKVKIFLWTTFVGSTIRNFAIIWIGAMGTNYAETIYSMRSELTESPLYIVAATVGLVIGVGVALFVRKRVMTKKAS